MPINLDHHRDQFVVRKDNLEESDTSLPTLDESWHFKIPACPSGSSETEAHCEQKCKDMYTDTAFYCDKCLSSKGLSDC